MKNAHLLRREKHLEVMIFVNVHEGLLKDGSSLTSYVFEANLWSNSED